jgi:hypothetical protein
MEIQVFTTQISSRLKYALDLILTEVGELKYSLITEKEQLDANRPILNYSGKKIEGSFQIHPFGLLSEKDIQNHDVPFDYRQDDFMVGMFLTEFDDLGFDIFSASFFIATRYEEYRKFDADDHGRFQPKDSILSKIGVLRRPIINIWVKALKSKLAEFWKVVWTESKQFEIINTIDVDHAWAYQNKGTIRTVGALGKGLVKGAMDVTKDRLGVLMSDKQDPYDTYSYIKELAATNDASSIFFFLLGDYQRPYDTNVSHSNKALQQLINEVSTFSKVGIHPSYASYLNKNKVKKEVDRLKSITKEPTLLSRQHFLKLSIPDSYRILEEIGVKHDYTMGYAQEVGFRAGLCTPFTYFDVLQDKSLDVTIHPFAYMDGTLNEYLKLSISEAKEQITFLKDNVKAVNGEFIGVWHNSSVHDKDEWEGWREVFEWGLKCE